MIIAIDVDRMKTIYFFFLFRDLNIVYTCQHRLCLQCFKKYATTKLNCRQFMFDVNIGYSLGCPHGCTKTLLNDLHVFRLMNQYNVSQYVRFVNNDTYS
jgi:RING/Ubox like zinc-binding domain